MVSVYRGLGLWYGVTIRWHTSLAWVIDNARDSSGSQAMRCFRDVASGPLNVKLPLVCLRYGAPAGGCVMVLEADCVRHPDLPAAVVGKLLV
jgi:hypothetical protein